MSQTTGELRFIACSGLGGKPEPAELSTVRRHVMRDYLHRNPRKVNRKKGTTRRTSRNAYQYETASQVSKYDAVVKTTASQSISRLTLRDSLDDDAASSNSEHSGITSSPSNSSSAPSPSSSPPSSQDPARSFVDNRYDCMSVTPVSSAAQSRIQARALFARSYCPTMSRYIVTTNIESMIEDPSIKLAVSDAGDALCLLQIAVTHQDKRCLMQAMTCYQNALAGMNFAITRSNTPQSFSDLMNAMFVLCKYETIACTDFPAPGWLQHATAFVALLKVKDVRARGPVTGRFKLIMRESFFLALHMGLASKQHTTINLLGLEGIFDESDLSLFSATIKVPGMLEQLASCAKSQRPETISKAVADALLLWNEIYTELQAWLHLDRNRIPTLTDIQALPTFYNAVGDRLCEQVQQTFTFVNYEAALVLRTVWMVLFVLGHDLIAQTAPALRGMPLIPCPLGLAMHGDLLDQVQLQVDRYAMDLCRTMPYMIENMAGFGRAACWAPIHHLKQYYGLNPEHSTSVEKLEFLERIKDTLLPGPVIEKMLAS